MDTMQVYNNYNTFISYIYYLPPIVLLYNTEINEYCPVLYFLTLPSSVNLVPSRNATFTLTNVVPQNPKLNQNAWANHESKLTKLFNAQCDKAYVLVGAIPSADNWIIKNNVRRVNIPEYMWNAYCCTDRNGVPISSGAAIALNTEQNLVVEYTLKEMVGFLQQYSNVPVGELFQNQCQ